MTQPSAPLGMSDFFALEAGEYLERLDALIQGDGGGAGGAPAADEFVRLARALRGSALMASQQAIARAATGLETVARAVREGRRAWDPTTKQIAIRAVDDLKIFVRRAASWTEGDTAKAEALAAQLEQFAGRPSAQVRAAEALGLDAGARAFVAREGAAIASALDRAAQVLRSNPLAHDPLQHVLKALQPLRGLAALNDLPPLPDLLEGIERAIGELNRTTATPPGLVGDLFQTAAGTIAHAAREVAERGRPDPDSAEFRKFAGLLVRFMDSEPDVVPIDALFHAGAGPHVVRRGTPAAGSPPPPLPPTLGRLELVSHGEHLRQAADSLERAPSATQRELRAHTLGSTFRALGAAGGGPVAERVAEFAQAAREAVSGGIAVNLPAAFAVELRRAGEILSRSGSGDEAALAADLAAVTAAIRALGTPAAAPVAIESLAPEPAREPAPTARRSRPLAPETEAVPESADLVGSWATYQRLVAGGIGPASLDEFLRAPSVDTTRSVTPGHRPGVSPSPGVPADPGAAPRGDRAPAVVDIRTLLYRGEQARRRAIELRAAAERATGDQVRAIIDEICDLVVLALEPEP
jgi:HPt (histidine-containing phosphotransfer) domain-containing protein